MISNAAFTPAQQMTPSLKKLLKTFSKLNSHFFQERRSKLIVLCGVEPQPVNPAVKRRREPFHSGLLKVNQSKWITLQPSQRQVLSQSLFYMWQCVHSNSLIQFRLVLQRFWVQVRSFQNVKYTMLLCNCTKIHRHLGLVECIYTSLDILCNYIYGWK